MPETVHTPTAAPDKNAAPQAQPEQPGTTAARSTKAWRKKVCQLFLDEVYPDDIKTLLEGYGYECGVDFDCIESHDAWTFTFGKSARSFLIYWPDCKRKLRQRALFEFLDFLAIVELRKEYGHSCMPGKFQQRAMEDMLLHAILRVVATQLSKNKKMFF